jgi:uncharacterized repeat protein (TIGR02543 family)
VYIGTSTTPPATPVTTTTETGAVIDGLTNDLIYYVWVKAQNSNGSSDYSRIEAGHPQQPTTSPAAPAAPGLSSGNGELLVSWQSVEMAESYEVWAGTSEYVADASKRGGDISGGITQTVITGLVNETTYYVWVKAKNAVGTSDFSPVARGKPSAIATVTFDADGGTPATQTRTVESGGSIGISNMPSDPARDGYVFDGWRTGQNGGGTEFTDSTTVTGDRRVYAKWTAIQYTVSFDADGGSPAAQTRMVNSGDSIGDSNMPPDPVKTGFAFDGWYTEQNGGGTPFTASTIVTADSAVYATWRILQHTVTFDADGGSPARQTKRVVNGDSIGNSNMPPNPVKSGHTFSGWHKGRDGGGTEFTATTTVTGDMVVYADWRAVSASECTVLFDPNGGSSAAEIRTVRKNSYVGDMPSDPVMSGYTFNGWRTGQNSGISFTALTLVIENLTV